MRETEGSGGGAANSPTGSVYDHRTTARRGVGLPSQSIPRENNVESGREKE